VFWHKAALIASISGTVLSAFFAKNPQEFVTYVGTIHMAVWSTWAAGNIVIDRLVKKSI
jgi:hypothetical protein